MLSQRAKPPASTAAGPITVSPIRLTPGESVALNIEVPRAAFTHFAAPPLTLSQRNSLPALGIPPRQFLEILRRPDFPVAVSRVGKLRLVEREPFLAWLRCQTDEVDPGTVHEQDGADEVLAEVGLRRVS